MPTHSMREMLERRLAGDPLPATDENDERRVRCALCGDDGTIRCWNDKTTAAIRERVKRGEEPFASMRDVYDMVCACKCRSGDSFAEREVKGQRYSWHARFDPAKHCRLIVSTTNEQDRLRLIEWLDNWRPSNYEPTFDRYNAGEF